MSHDGRTARFSFGDDSPLPPPDPATGHRFEHACPECDVPLLVSEHGDLIFGCGYCGRYFQIYAWAEPGPPIRVCRVIREMKELHGLTGA